MRTVWRIGEGTIREACTVLLSEYPVCNESQGQARLVG